MKPIVYYTDPGHGWFAVKRADCEALGILDRISHYSYQRGRTVYLEEDCDASLYFAAMKARDESELYLLIADEIEDKEERKIGRAHV